WRPKWRTSSWRIPSSKATGSKSTEARTVIKFAVIVFPGSNCDQDAYHAATAVLGQHAELVWHKDTDLKGADAVILPGGFAHGDYLRTGAIAGFSPGHSALSRRAHR